MSNQKLISDDDLGKLKIEVLECVKELHKAGGPAAGRFQAKLKFLIKVQTKIDYISLKKRGVSHDLSLHLVFAP